MQLIGLFFIVVAFWDSNIGTASSTNPGILPHRVQIFIGAYQDSNIGISLDFDCETGSPQSQFPPHGIFPLGEVLGVGRWVERCPLPPVGMGPRLGVQRSG